MVSSRHRSLTPDLWARVYALLPCADRVRGSAVCTDACAGLDAAGLRPVGPASPLPPPVKYFEVAPRQTVCTAMADDLLELCGLATDLELIKALDYREGMRVDGAHYALLYDGLREKLQGAPAHVSATLDLPEPSCYTTRADLRGDKPTSYDFDWVEDDGFDRAIDTSVLLTIARDEYKVSILVDCGDDNDVDLSPLFDIPDLGLRISGGNVWEIVFDDCASDFQEVKSRVRAVLECARAMLLARRAQPVRDLLPDFYRDAWCRCRSALRLKPRVESQLLNLFMFPVLLL